MFHSFRAASIGLHRYFLTDPRDNFLPDLGDDLQMGEAAQST